MTLSDWQIHRYSTVSGALGSITHRTRNVGRFILKVSWEGHREWLWSVHDKTQPHIVGADVHVAGGKASTLQEAKAAAVDWVEAHHG